MQGLHCCSLHPSLALSLSEPVLCLWHGSEEQQLTLSCCQGQTVGLGYLEQAVFLYVQERCSFLLYAHHIEFLLEWRRFQEPEGLLFPL